LIRNFELNNNIELDKERNNLKVEIKDKGERIMRVAVTYDN
jgi:hypothetical protein